MKKPSWLEEVPFAITVCDKEGTILEMNDKSALSFSKDGGKKLLGHSLFDCHSEKSRKMIVEMLKTAASNVYTIEKKGIKKLIYQCPWFQNGELGGLVELSIEIPWDLPHFKRD
jgi:transcriptional regulator with PAS, ATPase and Fis domain